MPVQHGYQNIDGVLARYGCGVGGNSLIVVTNNSSSNAIVSITLRNNANEVRDSRVFNTLNPRGVWEFNVHDVYFDWLISEPPWTFDGYATTDRFYIPHTFLQFVSYTHRLPYIRK